MPPLPDHPSPGVRLFPFRTRARRAWLPESPGLPFSPSPFIFTPNQRISERGDLRSTATRTTRASRLDQRLPFRPANLLSASCLVLGMATTAKESALQEPSTARLVSQPCYVQTHVTTLRTQPLISYPHSQVKKEAGEGTARLVGGRGVPTRDRPLPRSCRELPGQEKGQRALGQEVSEYSAPSPCDSNVVCVERRLPVSGTHGASLPRTVHPGCRVPVGKSDTAALVARGPRGIYPYIYIYDF